MIRLRFLERLLLFVALLAPSLAFADEPEPAPSAPASDSTQKADELKREGDAAMGRLAYEQALDFYERAYALDPNPALLYNRGRALQALTRYPAALDQLEAFAREADPGLKARVPKLAELIASVKKRVSTLTLSCNVSGARVFVRQRVVGTTPLAALRLNSGPAVVEVTADGYHPYKKHVTLPGGSALELSVDLASKNTTGLLEVSSPVAGAAVSIDGRHVGTVPVQTPLPAGKHELTVHHAGYDEADTSVVIRVGGTTRVDVPLDSPPPVTQKWWFWTGVGLVVVGGVALTAALLTERSADQGDIPPGRVSAPLLHF
jgi:PEGA domain